MSWANAWRSIISSRTGGDSSSIPSRVSMYMNMHNSSSRLFQTTDIDVVYTWVNGSDPALINDLLATRAKLRKSNMSRDFIIESWQEVNKCHPTTNPTGYFFLEVPIGFVEPRVTDFAVSLLDAKKLDDGVFTSSSPKGSLLYFKNIDQR